MNTRSKTRRDKALGPLQKVLDRLREVCYRLRDPRAAECVMSRKRSRSRCRYCEYLWSLLRKYCRHDFITRLEFDMSGATITLVIGDTSHFAVATNLNLDGSTAKISSVFSSDTPSVCEVDPATGALNPVAVGTAIITETATRGAFTHSDNGVVTVVAPPSDDFTTTLTFN